LPFVFIHIFRLPFIFGVPLFFALPALEKSNNPLYFNRLNFLTICRNNLDPYVFCATSTEARNLPKSPLFLCARAGGGADHSSVTAQSTQSRRRASITRRRAPFRAGMPHPSFATRLRLHRRAWPHMEAQPPRKRKELRVRPERWSHSAHRRGAAGEARGLGRK